MSSAISDQGETLTAIEPETPDVPSPAVCRIRIDAVGAHQLDEQLCELRSQALFHLLLLC